MQAGRKPYSAVAAESRFTEYSSKRGPWEKILVIDSSSVGGTNWDMSPQSWSIAPLEVSME